MKDDHRTANIDRDILKLIFDRVRLLLSHAFLFLYTNILPPN
jgi:hypothetical protein